MHWLLSNRADPLARDIADRHYNRQNVGATQFVPPGRCLVLRSTHALWITSYPYAEFVQHEWAGAMVCSAFRNEGTELSSDLIRDALAATRWRWPELPELGMVTFVDQDKVRPKPHPGYCFIKAGFEKCGRTKGGLIALQVLPGDWPDAEPPAGAQLRF